TMVACANKQAQKVEIDPASLQGFGPLPSVMDSTDNPLSPEKVALGRKLYFEKRLSKSQDISCNSCHPLEDYGAEDTPVSSGFKGQKGTRNAPTVFNAAGHIAQFWDGRAPDVEAQAKGPMMNPIEMAMPSDKSVIATLKAMERYREGFKKAFPNDKDPITLDNTAKAIGAFERTLTTPSRWDKYLSGDHSALSDGEKAGFNKFAEVGCPACHAGVYVGGSMFQKLGVVKPWPTTDDPGRFAVTRQEADRMVFKVPSLRNIDRTAPYFHDGSVAKLEDAVKAMAEHQLGRKLNDEETEQIVTWLKSLRGTLYTVSATQASQRSVAMRRQDPS
ncbi:MAG: cytochrome-c peroxidase, partial [Deltaproteobacteria bacterium]